MLPQQRVALVRHDEVADHRREVEVSQGQGGVAEIRGVGNEALQRRKHHVRRLQAVVHLGGIPRLPEAGSKDPVGEDLAHQRPIGVAVDDRDDLRAAGASPWIG